MEIPTIAGQHLSISSSTALDIDPSFNLPHPLPTDEDFDPFSSSQTPKHESQWHRIKWTDDMARLLVAIVAFIHDDGTSDPIQALSLRQSVLQTKPGKWKSVSKLMIDRGFFVSPQQCEDKFNDLNKRYKRLNEILGRGTTCLVVENPALLDSMANVSVKLKEDARKILCSKHLFYKEMCAYHNGQRIPDSQGFGLGSEVGDDSEEGDGGGGGRRDELVVEIDLVVGDEERTDSEKLEWIERRGMRIREERVGILAEALELERRSFKWERFRSKKDREMEKMRLENDRLMRENERMILELRHREMEIARWRSREARDHADYGMDVEH